MLRYWISEARRSRALRRALGCLGSEEKSVSEELSSQVSLTFKCSLVFLNASRLTSRKTNTVFRFVTLLAKVQKPCMLRAGPQSIVGTF